MAWYSPTMKYVDLAKLFAQTTSLLALFSAACSSKATLATSHTNGDAGHPDASDAYAPAACESTVEDAATTSDADPRAPIFHRPTAACCPSGRPPGPAGQPYPSGVASTCTSDSQCTAGVNGRCFPFAGLVGPGGCSYDECFTDSDCGPGATCLCRGSSTDNSANICVRGGNCVVDSDCGPGGYCSPSFGQGCLTPGPYFCHTTMDSCSNDSDCAPVDAGPSSCEVLAPCVFDPQEQRWACTQLTCCPP